MKRFCLVACFVVFFALLVCGCHKHHAITDKTAVAPVVESKPDVNVPAGRPQITFEQMMHDFGTVEPSSVNACEFKFKNTGTGLLKIEDVHAPCGCTTPNLEQKEYLPGQSGTISIKYRASSLARADTKYVYVTTNIPEKPKTTLTIKANIVSKVSATPEKLELSLRQPNAGCPNIVIQSVDEKPFSIKKIDSTGGCITADFNSVAEAPRFVLEPKVDIEKLRQLIGLEGVLSIGITYPGCDSVKVKFSAASEFKVEPSNFTLMNAEPNVPIEKKLIVRNLYNEPFELEDVSSRLGLTKIQNKTFDPNGFCTIDLLITPPPQKDPKNMFSDILIVKVKHGESFRVNCRGFYTKMPAKSVN